METTGLVEMDGGVIRDMIGKVIHAVSIVKAVGGVLDVVKDRENGSIVPMNDAGSLSKAIIKLLEDEALRKSLGESARQKIIRNFTLEKELAGNLDVYQRLGLNP